MIRRSTPQQKTDDLAFPVRVKVAVPPEGLGKLLTEMHAWLKDNLAPGNYACHSVPGLATNATAFYFRTTDAAHQFNRAFPAVVLADGTLSPVYKAPARTRRT